MHQELGMVGLGTMGRNLLLNVADHGFSVAGLDHGQEKADLLEKEGAYTGKILGGFTDAKAFVAALNAPRAIMMLVPAGAPVDSVIQELLPLLTPGDLLIDGGNSFFPDTNRRYKELAEKGFGFIGIGVSGGESGARRGPSMMAGGDKKVYEAVRPILEAVAAKADGEPCVALLGEGAAGHYVKMVHNGIEYALMQIIAEVYDIMKRGAGHSNEEIASAFDAWNGSEIGGFLLQITTTVLRHKEDGQYLVDLIQDAAKQKGTGKWTSQDAMDLHVPTPGIDAAVSARDLSALKAEREKIGAALGAASGGVDREGLIEALTGALHASILLSYAQGFQQLRGASTQHGFDIDIATAASIWRAGCIIRSELLKEYTRAYRANPGLESILLDPALGKFAMTGRTGLVETIARANRAGIPVPALSASLAYLDGARSPRLPANLIQGQRDFFGAHTYERLDKPGVFHTAWAE